MTEDMAPQHRVLKGVVVILGVLIMISMGVIIVTIYNRLTAPAEAPAAAAQVSAPASVPEAEIGDVMIGDIVIPLSPGHEVEEVETEGADIIVHTDGESADELLIIDRRSGELRGRITLQPEAP